MANSAATARARSRLPLAIAVTVAAGRALQQQAATDLRAGTGATKRAHRGVDPQGVLALPGEDRVHAWLMAGFPAPGGAEHAERERRDAPQPARQGGAPLSGGDGTPSSARAALVVSVWGASACTRPGGSGSGRSRLRSTHTSTIQPVAPSAGAPSRNTSKLRVMDLVPTRPT